MPTIAIYIGAALAAAVALLGTGALIFRTGVRQGQLTAKMAWNLQRGIDPMDDIGPTPEDTSPASGECK